MKNLSCWVRNLLSSPLAQKSHLFFLIIQQKKNNNVFCFGQNSMMDDCGLESTYLSRSSVLVYSALQFIPSVFFSHSTITTYDEKHIGGRNFDFPIPFINIISVFSFTPIFFSLTKAVFQKSKHSFSSQCSLEVKKVLTDWVLRVANLG